MPRSWKSFLMKPVALSLIFLVACLLFAAAAFAQSPSSTGLVRSGLMTIEGKSNDAVISGERHFVVTETTAILDVTGKRIELSDLAVPCEVEVKYELKMDQDPLCLRIKIRSLPEGSR
jgi:hypothetical protein